MDPISADELSRSPGDRINGSAVNKAPRVLAASAGGVLTWFGVAPVLVTGITDLVPDFGATNLIFLIAVLIGAALGDLLYRKLSARVGGHGSGLRGARRLALVLLAPFLVASAFVSFVSWDTDNLTSWRLSKSLKPAPDVRKYQHSVKGTQTAILEVTEHRGWQSVIASITTNWPVWLVGGQIELAARTVGQEDTLNTVDCEPGGKLGVDQDTSKSSVAETTLTLGGYCDNWRSVQLALPPGIKLLELRIDDHYEHRSAFTKIELAVIKLTPRYLIGWRLASILGFGLLLTIAYILLFDANKNEIEAAQTAKKGPIQQRNVLITAVIGVSLFVAIGNFFVHSFVSQERTIYTWDFAGHWMLAVNATKAIQREISPQGSKALPSVNGLIHDQRPVEVPSAAFEVPGPLASLIQNVRYSEYNPTAALPIAIPMLFVGPTRMAYELSLFNIYALFAVIVLIGMLSTIGRDSQLKPYILWPVIPVIVVLLFVPFWVPLVRGYLGVCVVGINLLVLWLYFRQTVATMGLRGMIAISVLLVAGIIFRRWNAYWVIGFFGIMFVDGLWKLIANNRFRMIDIVSSFRVPIVVGIGSFAILSVVAWPSVVTMLTTDYADIYSAYAENLSLAEKAGHFVGTFGLFLLLFFFGSAAYLIGNAKYRRIAVLLVFQIFIMVFHFSGTQTMGPHHMYILMPAVFILVSLAMIQALSRGNGKAMLAVGASLVLYTANGVVSGMAVFAPSGESVQSALVPLVPGNRYVPLVRHDMDQFEQLAGYLDSQLASMPDYSKIYVLASSTTFNSGHLGMLEQSTGIHFGSVDQLLRIAAVDKRDGFPRALFEADLVVTAVPVQLNRRPADQQVVDLPAKSILSGSGIGQAFERLPVSFELKGGVEVFVFRRTRPNTNDEIHELSDQLRSIYPDRPNIYE